MLTKKFLRVKGYKKSEKISLAQMPPKGYFVRYAQRSPKSPFPLRGGPYHPLWWNAVDSTFLQQAEVALVDSEACEGSKPQLPTRVLSNDEEDRKTAVAQKFPFLQMRLILLQRRIGSKTAVLVHF